MSDVREIKVFVASPGDLPGERQVFRKVVEELNAGFGDGAGCRYVPLAWEDTLATTGRRAQGVINQDIDACDVFVLLMWRRWGQKAPDSEYDSYTEEEFHRALDRFKKNGTPEIFVFFKDIDPGQMADPGEQLTKVLKFRKELEKTRHVLYRNFADEAQVHQEISEHLRAYAKGELPKPDAPLESFPLPIEAVEKIERAEAEAKREAERAEQAQEAEQAAAAQVEESSLRNTRLAAKAALNGLVEDARQEFALAIQSTTNLEVLYLAYAFYRRTGDLDTAEGLMQQALEIAGPDNQTGAVANAYGKLGLIHEIRGDLKQAEEMCRKALEINLALGFKDSIAENYTHLGNVYLTRDDLEQAEEMYRRGLEIIESLGLTEHAAVVYGNLGIVCRLRGELGRAEEMYRKALEINETFECKEGIINDYGNLGYVYSDRGDFHQASRYWNQALELAQAIGAQLLIDHAQGLLDSLAVDAD